MFLFCFIVKPLKCSSNYALLVLHLIDTNGRSISLYYVTPSTFVLFVTFYHTMSAVGLFWISIYSVPPSHSVYTSLTKYLICMIMCTSPPCSLQSLSLDLLSKMTSSLAQNNTMVKLVLHCENLAQKEDVKLFTHHLLLGLSTNTTLTDLSLSLPRQCWVWLLEGEVCGSFEENYCNIISNPSKLILCKLYESLHCCVLFT